MNNYRIVLLTACLMLTGLVHAGSAEEIDLKADAALTELVASVPETQPLLDNAAGVLIFPVVVKSGFGNDIEYGEGALRVGGKTIAYYVTSAEALSLQLGAQKKSLFVVFRSTEALTDFREPDVWVTGEHGDIDVFQPDTPDTSATIVTVLLEQGGPVYSLSLDGLSFRKLDK